MEVHGGCLQAAPTTDMLHLHIASDATLMQSCLMRDLAYLCEKLQGECLSRNIIGIVLKQRTCHEPHSVQLFVFPLYSLQTKRSHMFEDAKDG